MRHLVAMVLLERPRSGSSAVAQEFVLVIQYTCSKHAVACENRTVKRKPYLV
jgi:hypothetical protein